MKILVDMNLSPRWAAELRSLGFESTHWSMVGKAAAPDEEVLARWRANSRKGRWLRSSRAGTVSGCCRYGDGIREGE